MSESPRQDLLDRLIGFTLNTKLVVLLAGLGLVAWGLLVAPFDWDLGPLPRDPVPVDAIPDYGENQQIVFTAWPGRSPRDVEDQITYPLTATLLGMPGVKTVRSFSYFGFSNITVIFDDSVEFYWSRTRILEKLASLPPDLLPADVRPGLGPDATALGQIFQYTLEGRDPEGNPAGGWDLEELRSLQDWTVRLALMAVEGVAEVSSVGGFVSEVQIDVDPDALHVHGVSLEQVLRAVSESNRDVSARTVEINRAEYVIRGLGLIQSLEDVEETVITVRDHVPIRIREVAHVHRGPAPRRGVLDVEGQEAVGGIVVVRQGENPLATIDRVRTKIAELSDALPRKTLPDGTVSQVTVVPFYDRTELIQETLGTLNAALVQQILVTVIVVLLLVLDLRSAFLISSLVPLAVLVCFIAMKHFEVDANIVALSGIAIAIGTLVDMGIVLCENILTHLRSAKPEESRQAVIQRATREVAPAVLTAVLTTVISFLPVFTLEAAEGKLFRPLAFTKTFVLLASVGLALFLIPPVAHLLWGRQRARPVVRAVLGSLLAVLGVTWWIQGQALAGSILLVAGGIWASASFLSEKNRKHLQRFAIAGSVLVVLGILSDHWLPLGAGPGLLINALFVAAVLGLVFLSVMGLLRIYEPVLRWCLRHPLLFGIVPALALLLGVTIWLGAPRVFSFLPTGVASTATWQHVERAFPGLGREFMPRLSEGSFLYMPTTMPHASLAESLDMLQKQDRAIRSIPEVSSVVGKIGRADSPLDPAPISMVETIISFHPEYLQDESGRRKTFRHRDGEFVLDGEGRLIEDPRGRPFRQWRDEIRSEQDIWEAIERVARVPGATSAPKLQPIETRMVMLQTGMRAPLGLKVFGPDLESLESASLQLERLLKRTPGILADTVNADRVIGKPYLEIELDRVALGRHGISVQQAQRIIEVAIGGRAITTTIEGRERYPVRVRYARELRDSLETIQKILVPTAEGAHVPLEQIATLEYRRGPVLIKSENSRLVAYVTFDSEPGLAEVEAVEKARDFLEREEVAERFERPDGVTYAFAGSYENQQRAARRLLIVVPVALLIIFTLLYLQFRSVMTTLIVFSGVFVAFSGGFLLLWLYGQDGFLDVALLGQNLREIFQVRPYNLSVAVWVGFLALAGIATDDGVINATYLQQTFRDREPTTREEIHEAVVAAGNRRIRPCLMTVATTILALIPVLSSTGRGSDILVPMAIPTFGGMTVALITVFIVPTLYGVVETWKLKWKRRVEQGES